MDRYKKVTCKMEEINPGKALRWLAENTENQRSLKENAWLRIAHDITTGNWIVNGSSICFDEQGRLIDGQHRLKAIAKAGITVYSMVVRNLPAEGYTTHDQGVKRSLADVLTARGYKDCNVLATVLKRLEILDTDPEFVNAHLNIKITTADSLAYLASNPQLPTLIKASPVKGNSRLLSPGLFYVIYLAHRHDHETMELAGDFLVALLGTAPAQSGNPAHVLRERLIKGRMVQAHELNYYQKAVFLVKAWNAWAQDKPLNTLRHRRYGANREEFPSIWPYVYDTSIPVL